MQQKKIYAPSWLIIGISLVLMIVVLIMGAMTHEREKQSVTALLQEKGAALIQAFEAGARTGMMGLLGDEAHLQALLEETARRSDIRFIALVDAHGYVLAGSEKQRAGVTVADFAIGNAFAPNDTAQWRIRTDAQQGRVFEVYKRFLPTGDDGGGHAHHMEHMTGMGHHAEMECASTWIRDMPRKAILDAENRPTIVIGMDIRPYEAAIADEARHNIITAAIVFLVALAGVVSLFWAQNCWRGRKLLGDTRAVASEIVRSLPVGMVVVGSTNTILYINEVACSLLSVPAPMTEGTPASELLPPSLVRLHAEATGQKSRGEQELTLTTADHQHAVVNVSTSTVFGEEGQYIGYMFILQDVTDLRNLERGIRQREKLAAIGDLAAGIAHEIRNPLSSIKGYVTYFGSLFAEGSENREVAAVMAGEVDRVNRVISELLEFARPSDLRLQPTDLHTLLDHALHIIAHDLQGAHIRVNAQLPPDLPPVDIDPDRMTQVLLNILLNAIQAMPQGGTLTVTAQAEEGRLAIRLADTGEGIAEEDQANIFNPYFTTKKNGTGLGLAIVHKIVEDHGGSIQVCSALGEGTALIILLPLRRAKDA